jgi:hypothetical protein
MVYGSKVGFKGIYVCNTGALYLDPRVRREALGPYPGISPQNGNLNPETKPLTRNPRPACTPVSVCERKTDRERERERERERARASERERERERERETEERLDN